ncbi:MAG: PilZ domain-containing protein [Deltaproteobacteria bacterium]|nr:PilZ domain-containing protein [Deltaproteobacteria bacterium]
MDKLFVDKGGEVQEFEGRDKRKQVRFPVCLSIKYTGKEFAACPDFILNINKADIFILLEDPLDKGAELTLVFEIPEEKVLCRLEGEVVGVNTNDPEYPKGMQVRFRNHLAEDLQRLEDYLEGKKHLVDETV